MFTKPQDVLTGLSKQWRRRPVGVRKSSRITGVKPCEKYDLLEGLMDILAFLVDKLWQKW